MTDRAAGDADDGTGRWPGGRLLRRRPGGWRDWWTLLHPPYTAWHLSYVVIGASLAPHVDAEPAAGTLVAAFFLAVGVAAHALDELHGRPLRTGIPAAALRMRGRRLSLAGAVGLGVYGITQAGWILVPFMVAGPVLVIAYNAELFGGILHNDLGFAAAWGAFPVLTGYAAQDGQPGPGRGRGRRRGLALSAAQRRLSTPARISGGTRPGSTARSPSPTGRRPARRGPAAAAPGRGAAGHVVRPYPARRRPGHRASHDRAGFCPTAVVFPARSFRASRAKWYSSGLQRVRGSAAWRPSLAHNWAKKARRMGTGQEAVI